ncbi:MAG: phage head closure protein [Alphaproteobacteria bacterium]|nr:phage head closure protein [Alphaproteobacteria bacterium]MBV8548710.1 phage head closure protein [Alphaproteobacteria bacterium]
MSIGTLRKRVSFQSEQMTADGAGGYVLSWVTVMTVWAEIEPLQGSKRYVDGHLEAEATHKITARYQSGLTTDMRITYSGRTFKILSLLNKGERNQWLDVMVREGGAA